VARIAIDLRTSPLSVLFARSGKSTDDRYHWPASYQHKLWIIVCISPAGTRETRMNSL
jgi:hypothetical protein